MRDKLKEVSDSDDSEAVDDPKPVLLAERTFSGKSVVEKNLSDSEDGGDSEEESIAEESEGVSNYSDRNQSNSVRDSLDKSTRKTPQNSSKADVTTKKKSSGKDAVQVQATFNTKDLSSDDEVFIFHCPENFKKHSLLNKTIDISKSSQFIHIDESERFHLEILNSKNQQVTLAVPQNTSAGKLVKLPLKGHMVIQKLVEMEGDSKSDLNEVEDAVVFPNDIKLRHPFLGVNWKSYIDSANEAIEKNQFRSRKKIKKEKIKERVDEVNIKSNKDSSESPKKKKRKLEDYWN